MVMRHPTDVRFAGRHPPAYSARSFDDFVASGEPAQLQAVLVAMLGVQGGQDAAAEAMSFAFTDWSKVSRARDPVRFLATVGRRLLARMLRHREIPVPPNELASGGPQQNATEPHLELEAALARLTKRQRTAVVLVCSYGWTLASTATAMGIKMTTVQNHVERGLANLRRQLEEGEN